MKKRPLRRPLFLLVNNTDVNPYADASLYLLVAVKIVLFNYLKTTSNLSLYRFKKLRHRQVPVVNNPGPTDGGSFFTYQKSGKRV
jgi:hypothetical protein